MTDNQDYRLYLEERFNGIHSSMNAQFMTTHETLKSIEVQTKKTNGRVTELEKWKKEHCGEATGTEKSINEIRASRNEFIKVASFVIGALALCFTAISSLRNSRIVPEKIIAVQDSLRDEIRKTKGIPDVSRGWLYVNDNGIIDSIYLLKK